MKRSISLILTLSLLIGIFAVAGRYISDNRDENALNVSIIVSTAFGDGSINDSAHLGGEALEKAGTHVRYVECANNGFKQSIMDNAADSDVVVCIGWQFWEITDCVVEFPNVKFIWIDNAVEEPDEYPNLISVIYSENQPSYLAGYIASATSQTGTIGFVGGNDDDITNNFLAGYTQGAKDCNDGVDVITAYADGVYDDPNLGMELAKALNLEGADVIFQAAGGTGEGVLMAAKEDGFHAIGCDIDQKKAFPEYDDAILCSVVKRVGETIRDLVQAYEEDEVFNGGEIMVADIKRGYVDLSYGGIDSSQLIDTGLKEEITELRNDIKSEYIRVDSTR